MSDKDLLIGAMEELCDEYGLDSTLELDNEVHDLASLTATNVNNAGTEAQLEFIARHMGLEATLKLLVRIIIAQEAEG
jgi:hypothetical protein